MRRLTIDILTRCGKSLLADRRGQDLLEYGLVAALIAVVAIAAVGTLGQRINNVLWQSIVNNF